MIIVMVDEPPLKYPGIVWFDPVSRLTQRGVQQTIGSSIVWIPITTTLPSVPAMQGDIFINITTKVPHEFDGFAWMPAVPHNYNFPPITPSIGTLWTETITQIDYIYVSGKWIDFNLAMATHGGSTASPAASPAPTFQNTTYNSLVPIISSNSPSLTIYGPNNMMLVTIDMVNGTMTYGPNYSPDAAALTFWNAVAGTSPRFMQSQIDDLIKDLKDATSKLATAQDLVQKFKDAGFNIPEPPKPLDPNDSWDRAMGIIK